MYSFDQHGVAPLLYVIVIMRKKGSAAFYTLKLKKETPVKALPIRHAQRVSPLKLAC